MFTGEQIRAARSLARIEQIDLAQAASISVETLKRFEATVGPLKGRDENIRAVIEEIERRGIEFISDIDIQGRRVGVGVRFSADPHAKLKELILGAVADAGELALAGLDLGNRDPEYLAQHLSDHLPKWLRYLMQRRLQSKVEMDGSAGDLNYEHSEQLPTESRNEWLARLKQDGLPAPKSKRPGAPRRIAGEQITSKVKD